MAKPPEIRVVPTSVLPFYPTDWRMSWSGWVKMSDLFPVRASTWFFLRVRCTCPSRLALPSSNRQGFTHDHTS